MINYFNQFLIRSSSIPCYGNIGYHGYDSMAESMRVCTKHSIFTPDVFLWMTSYQSETGESLSRSGVWDCLKRSFLFVLFYKKDRENRNRLVKKLFSVLNLFMRCVNLKP